MQERAIAGACRANWWRRGNSSPATATVVPSHEPCHAARPGFDALRPTPHHAPPWRVTSCVVAMLCAVSAAMSPAVRAQDIAAGHRRGHVDGPTGRSAPSDAHDLAEQLLGRDSVVRRWPDRTRRPIRVWLQSAPVLPGWDAAFPAMVRDAFSEWAAIGLPIRFAEVSDSVTADVHVLWADRLGGGDSGRAVWWSTPNGWISRARISLSMHASDGVAQSPLSLRAVALHEIGHALGLGHVADARHIMAEWIEVGGLSDADRNTMALLYSLPAGRLTPAVLATIARRSRCITALQRCNAANGDDGCRGTSCAVEVNQRQ